MLRFSEQELQSYRDRVEQWQAAPSLPVKMAPQLREAIDKANRKAVSPFEDQEQEALVVWLRQKGIRHNATPNGGHRHKATAGKLKAQGVVSGVPDLTIWPHPKMPWLPILFIELKRVKGGTVSESQKGWLDYLGELEAHYNIRSRVCHGFEEARAFITAYGY